MCRLLIVRTVGGNKETNKFPLSAFTCGMDEFSHELAEQCFVLEAAQLLHNVVENFKI